MANGIYDNFRTALANGTINLSSDTIKVMLVTSAYTPNFGTHVHRSDVTNEVTGTGYTSGGIALTSQTVSTNTTSHFTAFTASNSSWANSSITARGAVLYKAVGTAGTDILIGYVDFGADYTSTNGTFTITWDATNGVIKFN